jgi:hypothetical protein
LKSFISPLPTRVVCHVSKAIKFMVFWKYCDYHHMLADTLESVVQFSFRVTSSPAGQ